MRLRRDGRERIIAQDAQVQAELADVLRIAERRLQWKREMRTQALDRQHLCVLHLDALRAVGWNGPDLRVKSRAPFVLVVLL